MAPGAIESVVDRVKELTGGGAAYAIDATAIPAVVKQAQQSLAARGTLVALGLGAEEYVLDAIDLLQGGKRVMSSIEGDSDPQEMVPRLLRLRASGAFPMDDRPGGRGRDQRGGRQAGAGVVTASPMTRFAMSTTDS